MKRLWITIMGASLILTGVPASGGYRHLKQEMEGYAPPAWSQAPASSIPHGSPAPDGFEREKNSIEKARDRWAKIVDRKMRPTKDPAISPHIIEAAADDGKTLALLRERFSPGTLRALIRLRHPSIKAARARFLAALEGFAQVTQLDEMLRQYSAFTEGVMAGVGPMRGGADAIQMTFPYPGVTALKGQVAEKNVEAAQYAFERVRRDTTAQGIKAYWNLLYIHRAIGIARDTLDRLNHLESVATTRYGAGKTSYQDVVKIRINREKLDERLKTLDGRRVNLETELLMLMNLAPGRAIVRPAVTAPDTSRPGLAALYPLAIENRQELGRMRAMVGKMARMVEMAETMIHPDFTQTYSLYRDQAVLQAGSVRMKPTFGTGMSTTRGKGLPKNAWFGTRDAYLRETRRKLDALKADLADAEARTRLMVRTGWFDLDRALRERDLYNKRLVDLSQTSLDVSTRGYESGKVSFADVIASYNGWLDVNLASERRISDVGIARIELARRIGTRLPSQ
jgi:outer membrane protein, heavy metal efflux system